jgi:RNA polymerase sigma-70 factor (ECF subfamily)
MLSHEQRPGELVHLGGSATGWRELTVELRRFVGRRIAGPDADDVVQEALLRIQRGLPGLKEEQRFGPWVYQVTRSAIADQQRRRGRTLDAGRVPLAEEELAEDPPAGDVDLTPALLRCLSSFIAELPSPYREAITLTELEGLTQRAAAEMLGVSLSGMKSRVQRGRARLLEMFEACCAIGQDARGRVITCQPRSTPGAGSPTSGRCR